MGILSKAVTHNGSLLTQLFVLGWRGGGVGRGRREVSSCNRPISGVDITPDHLTVQ